MDETLRPSSRQAGVNERRDILQSRFGGVISIHTAAERLASLSLEDTSTEQGLLRTWRVVIRNAKETAEHHQQLSELLVAISLLPPAQDAGGNQLLIHNLRI